MSIRPTARAATNRAPVILANGRTGRLVYWPIPMADRRRGTGRAAKGTRARVELRPGVVVSVDPADITVVAAEGPT